MCVCVGVYVQNFVGILIAGDIYIVSHKLKLSNAKKSLPVVLYKLSCQQFNHIAAYNLHT